MRNLNLEAAVADAETRYVAANPKSKARFEAAARELNLRGIYIARRGFMSLSLPMTEADHDALVAAFEGYLADYSGMLAQLG